MSVRFIVWTGDNLEAISDEFANEAIFLENDKGELELILKTNNSKITISKGSTIAYEDRNNGGCFVIYCLPKKIKWGFA